MVTFADITRPPEPTTVVIDCLEEGPAFRYRCWAQLSSNVLTIHYSAYPIIRTTPAGVWIDDYGQERFVLNGNGKRWAHEKKEWALHSLIKRAKWSRTHALGLVARADAILEWYKTQQ